MNASELATVRYSDLIREMESLAEETRYFESPSRSPLYVRDPKLAVYLSSSKSFLEAIGTDRSQMIEEHSQRRLLSIKVVELEVDALITLKLAKIALIGKRPAKAKNLVRQAKALIRQSRSANPDEPFGRGYNAGKAAAENRAMSLSPVIRFCAGEILNGNVSKEKLKSQAVLADALLDMIKLHFTEQRKITRSTTLSWLAQPKVDKKINPVREAYDLAKKGGS